MLTNDNKPTLIFIKWSIATVIINKSTSRQIQYRYSMS